MQQGQRLRRAGLTLNGDEYAPAACQHVKDTTIVCLKPDAPHRAGEPQLRQIVALALKRVDERTSRQDSANPRQFEPFTGRTKRTFQQAGSFRAVLRDNTQRVLWKSSLAERGQSLL